MNKKLLHLVPATLLCFLFACQSAGNRTPLHKENSLENFSNSALDLPFLPSKEEEETSSSFERETEPLFWDLEDVDLSDVDEHRKLISFTFDDAPSRTMENILAVFAAFNEQNPDCTASATFFFNGGLFDNQTSHLLHAAYALGFELGNHTHFHADLTTLSKEELVREINLTDAALSKIDGKKRHLLRAPFGRVNELVKSVAPTPIIDWTIDTLDWQGGNADGIYRSVFENRFSGAIVLMHDGYEHTVSALKRLLPDLKADGYQVVTLSKMIKAHGCHFQRGSVYIRARKQF